MNKGGDLARLKHMMDAAERAIHYAQGRTRQDLDQDELLMLALVRLLEIVGEAARGVGELVREDNPSVPWKQISGTRDRHIHGYFDVDLDVVWSIINHDLPVLIVELEQIISNLEQR